MKFKWLCCFESDEQINSNQPTPANKPTDLFARRLSAYLQKNSIESVIKIAESKGYFTESLTAPILSLTVLESSSLASNTNYKVYAYGLQGSKVHEGAVIFGKNTLGNDEEIIISSDSPPEEKFLSIFYDLMLKKYFIKDLCFGTFIKILSEKYIGNSLFISFVDRRMMLTIKEKVLIVFLVETEERFEFAPNQSPVIVGRCENCNVRIVGKNISREQCTMFYDQEWFIRDGKSSSSRNGTWFMPLEKCEVTDGMIFNASKTIFSLSLEKGNTNN